MSDDFDPYRKWLGIPPEDQPPHHYRLLGIGLFEPDPDVIQEAADRQMAHVKTHKMGHYRALSQQLLNELSAARLTLLHREKKAAYDESLRQRLESGIGAPPPPPGLPADSPASGAVSSQHTMATHEPAATPAHSLDFVGAGPSYAPRPRRRAQKKSASPLLPLVLVGGGLAAGLLIWLAASGGDTDPAKSAKPPAETGSKKTDHAKANPQPSQPRDAPPKDVVKKPEPRPQEKPPTDQPVLDLNPSKVGETPAGETQPGSAPNPTASALNPVQPQPPVDAVVASDPPAAAAAVPDQQAQEAERKKIQEIYQDDYRSLPSPLEKIDLAAKLLRDADDNKSAAQRYVLYDEARELGCAAGKPLVAIQAIDRLSEQFVVDEFALLIEAMERINGLPQPAAAKHELIQNIFPLVDRAVDKDKYAAAQRLLEVAKAAGVKGTDVALRKRVVARATEVTDLEHEFELAKTAAERLAADPQDAQANLAYGKFLSFSKGDWGKGLPLLAKGSDESLKKLAQLEAKEPTDAGEQLSLASSWWDLAEAAKGKDKADLQERSEKWYVLVLPRLEGLDREMVEKRLETLRGARKTADRPTAGKTLFARVQRAARGSNKKLIRSQLVGDKSGAVFEDVPKSGLLLAGFEVSVKDGRLTSIKPQYWNAQGTLFPGSLHGKLTGNVKRMIAEKGYAVGGVRVAVDDTAIIYLELLCMKVGPLNLDPKDTKKEAGSWDPQAAERAVTIGDNGHPVIGVFGHEGALALGLVQPPAD